MSLPLVCVIVVVVGRGGRVIECRKVSAFLAVPSLVAASAIVFAASRPVFPACSISAALLGHRAVGLLGWPPGERLSEEAAGGPIRGCGARVAVCR